MPSELGGGEGDEFVGDETDELEELRDEIREEYKESSGEDVGGGPSDQNEEEQPPNLAPPGPQDASEGAQEASEFPEGEPEDEQRVEESDELKPDTEESASEARPSDSLAEPGAESESRPSDSEDAESEYAANEREPEPEAPDDLEEAKDSVSRDAERIESSGEGDEEAENTRGGEDGERDDGLEELRERIQEQHEELARPDEDHSFVIEDEVGGDVPDEQDQQQAEDVPEAVVSSDQPSEDAGEAEQDGSEKEFEHPGHESRNEGIEDPEELRAEIGEQHDEAAADVGSPEGADVESLDAAATADREAQAATPAHELVSEDETGEGSVMEGSQALQDHQEMPDTIEEREDQAAPPDPLAETPTNESPTIEEERGRGEAVTAEFDQGPGQAAPESLANEDVAGTRGFQMEDTRPDTVPEESASGNATSGADVGKGLPEPDPALERDSSEESQADQISVKTEYDSPQFEMPSANGPDEPDAKVSPQSESEVGERGLDSEPKPALAEVPPDAPVESIDFNKPSSAETPTRAEGESKDSTVGTGDAGQPQPDSLSATNGAGGGQEISLSAAGEASGLASGQSSNIENSAANGSALEADQRWSEAQATHRESIDQNFARPTESTEVRLPLVTGESGAYSREVAGPSISGEKPLDGPGDSGQRRDLPDAREATSGTERRPSSVNEPLNMMTFESKSTKEQYSDARDASGQLEHLAIPDAANGLVRGKSDAKVGDVGLVPPVSAESKLGASTEYSRENPAVAVGDRVNVRDFGSSVSSPSDGSRESITESRERSYTDWRQVAGYFDGDGTADYYVGKRVVHPNLGFTDNYRPHLEMVREFLLSQGANVERLHDVGSAWGLKVAQAESVQKVASMMEPHLFKKREEVQAILDYYDNEITGTQLAEAFNESVREGNRTGKIRVVDVPYTRQEGQALSKKEHAEHAKKMGKENQKLTDEDLEQIRSDITSGAATNGELARKYGVSASTISRAVFGRGERG